MDQSGDDEQPALGIGGSMAAVPTDPAEQPRHEPADIKAGDPPNRDDDDPTEAHKATVARWWQVTGDNAEWQRFTRQIDRDTATIFGEEAGQVVIDEQKETEDRATVTTRHVYRNAVQAVALTCPQKPDVEYVPLPQAPDFSDDGTTIPDSDGVSVEVTAFATCLTLLVKRLMHECHAYEGFRGWYQDAHHYEVAWVKVTFQRDYQSDPQMPTRLQDDQDLIARAQTLLEQYERQEFTENEPQYREMCDITERLQTQPVMVLWRGLVFASIPARMVRVDPMVKRPEDWRKAGWVRHDTLMRRDDILAKYKGISPTDLQRGQVYNAAGSKQANEARESEGSAQLRPIDASGSPLGQDPARSVRLNDWDLLLVAEIWSRTQRKIVVLVEGIDYLAAEIELDFWVSGFYQFVPIILNRPPGNTRFAGLSDSENQAKAQDELNSLATDEEYARRSSEFRFMYDKDVFQDDDLGKKVAAARAFEGIPVSFDGRDMQEHFIPIPGNGAQNSQLFAASRARINNDLRSMSGLPEQLSGGTGAVDFAAQIDVAAQGANALCNFRRGLLAEATDEVLDLAAQIVIFEFDPQEVADLLGPNVLKYWPQDHQDRMTLYRKLQVKSAASLGANPNKKATIDGLEMLADTAQKQGEPIDTEKLLQVLARTLELPTDTDQIIKLDPNSLALRLSAALKKSPGAIDPAALQQLSQVLMPLIQQMIAQQTQAIVQGAPGPGPQAAPPGMQPRPMPPRPGPGGRPPSPMPPRPGPPAPPAPGPTAPVAGGPPPPPRGIDPHQAPHIGAMPGH